MSLFCISSDKKQFKTGHFFFHSKQNEKMSHIWHNGIPEASRISNLFAFTQSQWAVKIPNVFILHQYRWNTWCKTGHTICFTCTDAKWWHLEFRSSLTLNKGKPVWYSGNLWYPIVSNMTHFFILFEWEKKIACFGLSVSLVLTQNEDIWNFHGLLTLDNRKLMWYLRSNWYAIVSKMTHFSFCFEWEKNGLFWTMFFIWTDAKWRHLEFSQLIDFE